MSKYQIGFINKKRNTFGLIGIYISESGKLDKFVAPPGVPIIDTTKIASSSWAKAIQGHLSVAGGVELPDLIQKLLSVGGVLQPEQDGTDYNDHDAELLREGLKEVSDYMEHEGYKEEDADIDSKDQEDTIKSIHSSMHPF